MNALLITLVAALPGASAAIALQPVPITVGQDISELIAQLEGGDPGQRLAAAQRSA